MGKRIRKIILVGSWAIAAVAAAVLTASVLFEVVARYFLHLSISWPEELARYSCVWCSMLGACIALEQAKLHDMDFVFNYLPDTIKPYVAILSNLFVWFLLAVLSVYGTQLTLFVHSQVSPAMEIPMSYVYGAVPLASGLMLIINTLDTIEKLTHLPFLKNKRVNV